MWVSPAPSRRPARDRRDRAAIEQVAAAIAGNRARLQRWERDPKACVMYAARRILTYRLMLEPIPAGEAMSRLLATGWLRDLASTIGESPRALASELMEALAATLHDDGATLRTTAAHRESPVELPWSVIDITSWPAPDVWPDAPCQPVLMRIVKYTVLAASRLVPTLSTCQTRWADADTVVGVADDPTALQLDAEVNPKPPPTEIVHASFSAPSASSSASRDEPSAGMADATWAVISSIVAVTGGESIATVLPSTSVLASSNGEMPAIGAQPESTAGRPGGAVSAGTSTRDVRNVWAGLPAAPGGPGGPVTPWMP
jgi:hypothetical protein